MVTKKLEIESFVAALDKEISKEGKIWGLTNWAGLKATVVIYSQEGNGKKQSGGRGGGRQ
jgi:hypothetical protein